MMSIPPNLPPDRGQPPPSRDPTGRPSSFRLPERKEGRGEEPPEKEIHKKKDFADSLEEVKKKLAQLEKKLGKEGLKEIEKLKKQFLQLQSLARFGKVDEIAEQELAKLQQQILSLMMTDGKITDGKVDNTDFEKSKQQFQELLNQCKDSKVDKETLEKLKMQWQELLNLGIDKKVDVKDLQKLKEQKEEIEKNNITMMVEGVQQPFIQTGFETAPNQATQESLTASTAQEAAQISKLVLRLVDSLMVTKVEGQDMVSMQLGQNKEVPTYLANSNLSITQHSANSISITFSNFDSVQQENKAVINIEKAKAQLTELVGNLQARKIEVTEMRVGDHRIELPKVEALPPPFTTGRTGEPLPGIAPGQPLRTETVLPPERPGRAEEAASHAAEPSRVETTPSATPEQGDQRDREGEGREDRRQREQEPEADRENE